MFERKNRARNQDGTFKKDVWWTPWSDSWEYKMSEDLKDMLELGRACEPNQASINLASPMGRQSGILSNRAKFETFNFGSK